MGNVLKRLSYTFPTEPYVFLCHGGGRLTYTPFPVKFLYLDLWRSCSSWLGRTITQPILVMFDRLRSIVVCFRNLRLSQSPYTHMTPEMEEKYWRKAAIYQARLQRSDARYVDGKMGFSLRDDTGPQRPPLVMYYTPALLPERRGRKKPRRSKKYYISAKDYCKWHRMVFPGDDHPTLIEASKLRKIHDAEELRVIHRISRMLSDDEVFPHPNSQPKPWTPKYRRKWLKWRSSHREALERQ